MIHDWSWWTRKKTSDCFVCWWRKNVWKNSRFSVNQSKYKVLSEKLMFWLDAWCFISMFIDEAQHQQAFSISEMKLYKLEYSIVHDDDSTLE